MSAPWTKEATAHVDAAREAIEQLAESPRRAVLARAVQACTAALDRAAPDPGAVAEALRGAMQSAAVLVTEAPDAQEIAGALGSAYNAALGAMRPGRLEAAPLPRLTHALDAVAGEEPRTSSITRERFEPPGELAGEDLVVADDADDDADDDDDDVAPEEVEDWRPTEGVAPEPPPVVLLAERRTLSLSDYRAAVVEQCLEAITAFARDRSHDPFSSRPEAERKILAAADAVLATGSACVATVLAWWERAIDSPSPWCSWAAPFVLGCIEGADALLAVRCGLEQLPAEAVDHSEQAAEALSVVRHPDRPALAVDLAGSPHPIARAVGVDMLARAGQLTVEQLRPHLFDPHVPVAAAALRAVGRLDAADGAALAPLLERWILFPDATIAWLAARTLLRWGNTKPHDELRQRGRFTTIVGARAVDLLALAGDEQDMGALQALVARTARTPALLAALARFGHPGVAAFLVHYLSDEDLADDAASALVTIFGPRVDGAELLSGSAWKAALAARPPDAGTRYRRGAPWSPSSIAAELEGGELSRLQMAPLLDELTVRAGVEAPIDLAAWSRDARPLLAGFCKAARDDGARWPATGWDDQGRAALVRRRAAAAPAKRSEPHAAVRVPEVQPAPIPVPSPRMDVNASASASPPIAPIAPSSLPPVVRVPAALAGTSMATLAPKGPALPFAPREATAPSPPPSAPAAAPASLPPSVPAAAPASLPPVKRVPAALSGTSMAMVAPKGPALPFAPTGETAPPSAPPSAPAAAPPSLPPVKRAPAALSGTSMAMVAPKGPALPFAPTGDTAPSSAPPRPAEVAGPLAGGPAGAAKASPSSPFSAAAEPPSPAALSLQQYASLCVELAVVPGEAEEILRRYQLTAEQRQAVAEHWQRHIAADAAVRTAFDRAYAAYKAWFVASRAR